MKYLYLGLLFLLGISCSTDQPSELIRKENGALEALQMLSAQRAYPFKDIPKAGYYQQFEKYHLSHLEKNFDSSVEEWEAKGPLNTAGRTLAVAVNPLVDSTIYAGSASGGLWRSRKLGQGISWERVPLGHPVLGVSSIAFAPGDSMVIYVGTGEVYNYESSGTGAAYRSTRGTYGIGILKSEDGGSTWAKSLDWTYNQNRGVSAVRVSVSNPNILYAGTSEGVFKSVNAGESWSQVLDIPMATDIIIHDVNPNIIIAGCGNFASEGFGLYRSTNGGSSWKKFEDPFPSMFRGKIQLASAPSNPDIMYASIGNGFTPFVDGASWLYRTADAGATWELKNTTDYSRWQGWFAHDVAVNPADPNDLSVIGIDIWHSTDGGDVIQQRSGGGNFLGTPEVGVPDGPVWYSHSDHHDVIFHPNIPNLVIYANDGGIFLSQDGGATFESANGGYQSTQFYNGFSVSHINPDFALGGLQDNSTIIFRGDGAWQRAIGGDGSWTGLNQLDNNYVYGSYQRLNIMRSLDGGLDFPEYMDFHELDEEALFIAPFVVSESNPEIIYAGGKYIYKTFNAGDSWIKGNLGNMINGGDPVFSLAVASSDPNIVYAGTVPGTRTPSVLITQDGGFNWENRSEGLPDRFINDLEIDPLNPNIAYASFSGFGMGHLFRTENFGQSWNDISEELPDVPGNAIAIDPDFPSHIYFGNDLGVYFSPDSGETWELFMQGIVDVILAMDLKISKLDRSIWIASHGNGSYKRPLVSPSTSIAEVPGNTNAPFSFEIMGNPVVGPMKIKISTSKINDFNWSLISLDGALIQRGNFQNIPSLKNHIEKIDIFGISNGIYVFTMSNGRSSNSKKVFISN